MARALRVLVAGGGIGGLAAATLLRRSGHEVILFERAPALREEGAGLQLSANALRVIERLGVLEALAPRANVPQHAFLRSFRDGAAMVAVPLGARGERRWGAPYWQVGRRPVLAVLADAALSSGVDVRTGQGLASLENAPDGVELTLDDGVQVQGDLLIGADGLHSAVRAALFADAAKPVFHNEIAARVLVPGVLYPAPPVSRDAHVFVGPGAHAVAYWVDDALNLVLVSRGQSVPAGRPLDPTAVCAPFDGWCEPVQAILEPLRRGSAPVPLAWPMCDLPPLRTWTQGRATLLGDAAHAMLPYMAQGAAQALEDAAVLEKCLRAEADPARALARYDRQRRPRATMVQGLARRNARAFHVDLGAARGLVHGAAALARPLVSPAATRSLDAVYGWKLPTP
jgi:salicylate hydroxylase